MGLAKRGCQGEEFPLDTQTGSGVSTLPCKRRGVTGSGRVGSGSTPHLGLQLDTGNVFIGFELDQPATLDQAYENHKKSVE
jgi:hypothetical protein